MVAHTSWCRTLNHSDAAKRISETFALHRLADPIGNIGHWFACAIADGTTDNVLYDSKLDAITHQHHNETYYAYVQIVPAQMSICDAEVFLSGVRKTYQARKGLIDRDHPQGGLEPIRRLTVEDQMAQNAGIPTNLIVPGRYRN
jgi:hypothetical protein